MARTSDPELAQRRRRQITEAALACFRKRGFHQASMQEICAQAQISPGALYRYFPSKNHLIAAIAEDVQIRVEAAIAQSGPSGDLMALLEAIGQVMLEEIFAPGDGGLVAEVMAEAGRDPDLAARLAAINRQTQGHLAAVIGAACDDGRLTMSIGADDAAALLLAVIDGLGVKLAMDPLGDPADSVRAYRAFLSAVFDAPLKPAKPSSKRSRAAAPTEDTPA